MRAPGPGTLLLLLCATAGWLGAIDKDLSAPAVAVTASQVSADLAGIQDTFFSALALDRILASPALLRRLQGAGSAGGTRSKATLGQQVPALADRKSQFEQATVEAVRQDLDAGRTEALTDVVRKLEGIRFPEDMAFVALARLVKPLIAMRMRDEGDTQRKAVLAQALETLDRYLEACRQGRDRDPSTKMAAMLGSLPQLAGWVNVHIFQASVDRPTADLVVGKLDLNQATLEQLVRIPGVSRTVAHSVLEYRAAHGGIDGMTDLEDIQGVGPSTLAHLQASAYAGDYRRPMKDWTVLVYSCMANNLESWGIHELNLMEKVGSTAHIHVIDQLARIDGYDVSNGNWASVRRYYVRKDADLRTIHSSLVATLGQVNMGDSATLVDFCRWAIPLFPAKHYCLIVDNHGGGSLAGIGWDSNFGNAHLSVPQLGQALQSVRDLIRERTGRPDARIDLVHFQACLMGMLEVAYELRDTASVMSACESIGYAGLEFDRWLADLDADPTMTGQDLARRIVRYRMETLEDHRVNGLIAGLEEAMGAYDLTRLGPLSGAVGELGKALRQSLDSDPIPYRDSAAACRPYEGESGCSRDLEAFCRQLVARAKDQAVVAAAQRVIAVLGHPVAPAPCSSCAPVTLVFDRAGSVIWGIDNWSRSPPLSMWPPGSRVYLQSSMIQSPLTGPDARGRYTVAFPPLDAAKLGVTRIDYRTSRPREGLGPPFHVEVYQAAAQISTFTQFGPDSPMIVEAHSGGYPDAHGLSMVLPVPDSAASYRTLADVYGALAWSHDSCWGDLIGSIGDRLLATSWR